MTPNSKHTRIILKLAKFDALVVLTMASSKKCVHEIATTTDNQQWQYGRQNRKYFSMEL